METDCTAPLSDMNVPRYCGNAAEVSKAIPGIMRPFMATKKLVVTSSTHIKGMGSNTVVKVMGKNKVLVKGEWAAGRSVHGGSVAVADGLWGLGCRLLLRSAPGGQVRGGH